MSDNQKLKDELLEFYSKKEEQDKKIIDEMKSKIKAIFPEEQAEFMIDMFIQVFVLSTDMDELHQGLIHMTSYVDAFYQALVVDKQLLTEEEFKPLVQKAYQTAIDDVKEATEQALRKQQEQE